MSNHHDNPHEERWTQTDRSNTPSSALSLPIVDRTIEPHLEAGLRALDGPAPLLSRMVRYHLGQIDSHGCPLSAQDRQIVQGKRLRPRIALLCCEAIAGDSAIAAPVAAAIELLHNFTLIHDDIQDRSLQRRHRDTVWSRWGDGQAINAGDATFASAQLTLYQLAELGVSPALIVVLSQAFARMTIEIVQGQVLDLGFEGLTGTSPDAYLQMISLKTAAIVRFAAWSGALLGGADASSANHFADFGSALGVGFQIRDDFLGIWGDPEQTGKPTADDIRRRKQALPLVMLLDTVEADARAELSSIFAAPSLSEPAVDRVLQLLAETDVRDRVEREIDRHHVAAQDALTKANGGAANDATAQLLALVESLRGRSS